MGSVQHTYVHMNVCTTFETSFLEGMYGFCIQTNFDTTPRLWPLDIKVMFFWKLLFVLCRLHERYLPLKIQKLSGYLTFSPCPRDLRGYEQVVDEGQGNDIRNDSLRSYSPFYMRRKFRKKIDFLKEYRSLLSMNCSGRNNQSYVYETSEFIMNTVFITNLYRSTPIFHSHSLVQQFKSSWTP